MGDDRSPRKGTLAGTEIVVRAGYLTAVNASTGTALRVVRMPALAADLEEILLLRSADHNFGRDVALIAED
jgi:hypothetical protein